MVNQWIFGHVDVSDTAFHRMVKLFLYVVRGIMAELATGQALFGMDLVFVGSLIVVFVYSSW